MDALLRRHYDRIWAICRRIAGNDADAADASQEAMLLIVRRLSTYDGRASFRTWSHRVATNACLDELRRRRRRPVVGIADDDPDGGQVTPDATVGHDRTVTDRLVLEHALAALPEEFRAPVVLRDIVGHDYAEIAEILDLAPGTVRSRIARGRTRLAAALASETGDVPGEPDDDDQRQKRRP